jgi:hypothetical protein
MYHRIHFFILPVYLCKKLMHSIYKESISFTFVFHRQITRKWILLLVHVVWYIYVYIYTHTHMYKNSKFPFFWWLGSLRKLLKFNLFSVSSISSAAIFCFIIYYWNTIDMSVIIYCVLCFYPTFHYYIFIGLETHLFYQTRNDVFNGKPFQKFEKLFKNWK